ncbi:CrcB family protein [Myceligenerans sp. TRM 65318]|uniref:Fluoride-specific ion channel FluC n=2 Tax=Myceligenerans pegani TaxID=2776917 RepID=A0ABR9N2T6_9MICO|nr:CrcB family protein [Myceligenerans sp. TRM 65318]MBE3020233.1 CrcB family protein [Myceligenerans sp. TRM 65318]
MSAPASEPSPTPPGPGGRRRLPAHLRPALIGLVALGGALGSAARHGTEIVLPPAGTTGGWPLATLAVNLLGAFALGFGLEALARLGRETPVRRNVRLAGGTGFLGGFTTYSALALETERLLSGGQAGVAVAYVLVSLVLGALCCLAGVVLGERAGAAYLRRSRAVGTGADR